MPTCNKELIFLLFLLISFSISHPVTISSSFRALTATQERPGSAISRDTYIVKSGISLTERNKPVVRSYPIDNGKSNLSSSRSEIRNFAINKENPGAQRNFTVNRNHVSQFEGSDRNFEINNRRPMSDRNIPGDAIYQRQHDRSGVESTGSRIKSESHDRVEFDRSRSSNENVQGNNRRPADSLNIPGDKRFVMQTDRYGQESTTSKVRPFVEFQDKVESDRSRSNGSRIGISVPGSITESLSNGRSAVTTSRSIINEPLFNNKRPGLNVNRSAVASEVFHNQRPQLKLNNSSLSNPYNLQYPNNTRDMNTNLRSPSNSKIHFREESRSEIKRDTVAPVLPSSTTPKHQDFIYFKDSDKEGTTISFYLSSSHKPDANTFPDPYKVLANMNESITVKPFSVFDTPNCPEGSTYDSGTKTCRKNFEDY